MATPPSTDGWIVVTDRLPGPDAGLPEDRERARRVLDLAAVVRGPVTVAVAEPGLGAGSSDWAARAGVHVCALGADPVATLRDLLDQAGAIIATGTHQVPVLRRAGWTPDEVPLVLDLHSTRSLQHAAAATSLSGIKADGHEAIVEATAAIDRDALAAAALVLVAHPSLQPLVERIAPDGVDVAVVPVGALAEITPFGAQRHRHIVHPGAWSLEPGTPDEDGAHLLLDAVAPLIDAPVVLAGLDTDPRLRLRATDLPTAPPSLLDRAMRPAAAACIVRSSGVVVPARLLELDRLGVPTVATVAAGGAIDASAPALVEALGPLLDDIGARDEARAAAHQRVADHHEPARCRAALAAALETVGLAAAPAPTSRPPVDTVDLGAHLERAPGSLGASDPDMATFERELFGGPFLGRIAAIRLEHPVDPDRRYRLWASTWNQPRTTEPGGAAPAGTDPTGGIDHPSAGISIVMPTWNTDPEVLEEAIDSVLAQTDPRWQLCIADDASTERATHHVLDRFEALDDRIVVHRLEQNLGIAGASNAALALASLPFVGLLDHDDLLAADAVEWVLRLLDRDPSLDYVYTDEDKLDPHGMRSAPFCKPDWNPDLLLSCNYLTHFSVLRRTIVDQVGGFRAGFDGSQDYDLLLRVTEATGRIGHVARPLYTWRQIEGSTSVDTGAKPEAHDAGTRALRDALARRDVDGDVSTGHMATWHRVRYRHDAVPLVSVVIPTRDHVDLVRGCVERVRATVTHPAVEILVVDNQSTDPATVAWLREHERTDDGAVVRYPHEFSYARQMNMAATAASGSVLFMLNNDATPRSDGWFEAMVEHALRPEVGVVGARLRFPDGRAQHEGIILNVGGPAYNLDAGEHAVWGRNVRDVVAVTGAAMMCRTAVYQEAGGFEERLRVAFNDVDFCLRVGELGYRVVYTPYAELEHAESASRGALHPLEDEAFHLERWGPPYAVRDPFYNHALDLMHPLMLRI